MKRILLYKRKSSTLKIRTTETFVRIHNICLVFIVTNHVDSIVKLRLNELGYKAIYTTAPVAGGWAGEAMSWPGAVMSWAGAIMIWAGALTYLKFFTFKLLKNAKKVKWDG